MVLFKDTRDNTYYIKDDKLFVDLIALGVTRLIGKLNYNINTNECSLVTSRKSEERWKLGYLISAPVFDHFSIDRVVVIEDDKTVLILDWKSVKDQEKSWRFTPHNGYEDQVVVPLAKFSNAGTIGEIVLS